MRSADDILLSHDVKYLLIKIGTNFYVFDGTNGKQDHKITEASTDYVKFVNKNELIGSVYMMDTGLSKIVKYDCSDKKEEDFITLNKYFYNFYFNFNGKASLIEHENVLYYYEHKNGKNEPDKLIEGYDYIKKWSINENTTSVLYQEESKNYFALYEKSKLLFRKQINSGFNSTCEFIGCNKNNQIVYVENTYTKKVSLLIHPLFNRFVYECTSDYNVYRSSLRSMRRI